MKEIWQFQVAAILFDSMDTDLQSGSAITWKGNNHDIQFFAWRTVGRLHLPVKEHNPPTNNAHSLRLKALRFSPKSIFVIWTTACQNTYAFTATKPYTSAFVRWKSMSLNVDSSVITVKREYRSLIALSVDI